MRPVEIGVRLAMTLAVAVSSRAGPAMGQKTAAPHPRPETIADWPFFKIVEPVDAEKAGDSPWVDFVVGREVFTSAQTGLADLRLFDTAGEDIPRAVRVRRPKFSTEAAKAVEFNRAEGPDGSSELSLDLGTNPIEHNEAVVDLPGNNFRRRAVLEGSDDNNQWRQLAEGYLIRFHVRRPASAETEEAEKATQLEDVSLSYPASRFRYLRLHVYPDPVADGHKGNPRVKIGQVTVQRRVAVPGEMLTLDGELGPREATRDPRGSADPFVVVQASAWIVELGGDNVPVSRIEVEIADETFARDFVIESGGPPEELRFTQSPFRHVTRGTWQRRSGDAPGPMVAEFDEVLASRLRLVVVDHNNNPLDVRGVKFTAAARQVVFPKPKSWEDPIRLYYGNPKALKPEYDFARNLPTRLEPVPVRTELGPREDNPAYVPEPLPLTERWPWLVYTVLGGAGVLLGVLLVSVGRTAVREHDRKEREASDEAVPDEGKSVIDD